jgi:nucleotide-binding universal stress UspA family protein
VVAATDLSELGNRAIAHAYALVRGGGEGSVVHLLTVHERPLPRPAYAYAPDAAGALGAVEERELRARLLAEVPAEAAALGISTDITVVDGGEASEVICQTAARLGADAITLSSHGRGGVGRAVLGSIAGRVIHRADRPVFVVRQPTE